MRATLTMSKLALLLLPLYAAAQPTANSSWGIVFDCGSSGTRAHIYYWTEGDAMSLSQFTPANKSDEDKLQANPGISSFASNPTGVTPYMAKLLTQAARWVPAKKQPTTRVRALSTAGMRLLDETEQAPIYSGIDDAILATKFMYSKGDSQTIAGEYEGIFNLLALQFILAKSPQPTAGPIVGGLDLGGASTQITFRPESGVILNDAYRLVVNGTARRLFSHSYMHSGQAEAIKRYAQILANSQPNDGGSEVVQLPSPCHNEGYNETFTLQCAGQPCSRMLVGSGNWTACKPYTNQLLNLDNECLLPPCAAHGVYQPPVTGVTFYAVSAFFFTANGTGLIGPEGKPTGLSTAQLENAGDTWCKRPWAEAKAINSRGSDFCFSSAYIPSLLDAYRIPRDSTTSVIYANKIGGFSASWALGAMIFFMAEAKCTINADHTPGGGGGDCPVDLVTYEAMLPISIILALLLGGVCGGVAHYYYLKKRGKRTLMANQPSLGQSFAPLEETEVGRAPAVDTRPPPSVQ